VIATFCALAAARAAGKTRMYESVLGGIQLAGFFVARFVLRSGAAPSLPAVAQSLPAGTPAGRLFKTARRVKSRIAPAFRRNHAPG